MLSDRSEKWKLILIVFLMGFAVALVGFRLVRLHLDSSSDPNAYNAYSFTREIPGPRGTIYDANGRSCPLAVSIPVWEYHVDPDSVDLAKKKKDKTPRTREDIARTVADALKMPYKDVLAKFQLPPPDADGHIPSHSRYVPLAVSSDDAAHRILSDPALVSGVNIEERQVRQYPHGRQMCHVIGFVNALGIGCAGIEQQYNRYLTGIPGKVEGVRDARRAEIYDRRKVSTPPLPGADVFLTIDHNIQYEAETALAETIQHFRAEGGWALVENAKTGAILAMASYPDFDPAHYGDATDACWLNRVLAIVYEPGSIMKAVTVAAAMNEHLVTPNTVFDAYQGSWEYAGHILHDHPTGRLTVAQALAKSSNIVCAKIGLLLGPERLYRYLRAFGFGGKVGLELPGEENGLLSPWQKWDAVKPSRVPIGQGVAVTALQIVNAYSTLANDGTMVKPYLVEKIVSAGGDPVYEHRREVVGHPVRPEVARSVRNMLRGVTEEGTGRRAFIKGYSVAGKTGTAQKVVDGRYSDSQYWASFCGMVPASDPALVILVTVDHPQPQHTGGFVSCPVFNRIATAALRYLEIPPDRPEEVLDEDAKEDQKKGQELVP